MDMEAENQELIDNDLYEVLTPYGFKDFDSISIIYDKDDIFKILLDDNNLIECTHDHLIMTDSGWKEAQYITTYDLIETRNGFISITSISRETKNVPVYDLVGVQDCSCFYANNILVHNCNIILLDEYAFVPKNIADQFYRSVYPVISSGTTTKLIMVSTPFGMNHFYKMWNEAVQGINGFAFHRVFWNQIPGRDDKWRVDTINKIGAESFRQEFEGEFIGSAGTLIAPDVLKSLTYIKPYYEDIDGLKIYVAPKPKRVYMLSVDTSEGLGLDSHAVNIIDITEYPYVQVCTFRNNMLDPMLLPDVVFSLATKYNNAYVIIELNSMGTDVAKVLKDELEYENMLYVVQSGRKGQVLTGGSSSKIQNGLKMTKQSKRVGCQSLKTLIENQKLIINDFDTYSELTTFVRAKDSYEAEAGANDDTVMSLVVFAWVVNQKYFKEEMEQDIRKNINRQTVLNIDENLLPFGVFDDGIEETHVRQRVDYDTEFVSSSFFD